MVFVGVADVSRKQTGGGTGRHRQTDRQTEHETLIARGCILCYAERCDLIMTLLRVLLTTSGQRILTKDRIAPVLVTAAAGESILKQHFCHDALSRADKSAAPVRLLRRLLLTQSNAFQGDKHPKLPPLPKGPGPRLIHGSRFT